MYHVQLVTRIDPIWLAAHTGLRGTMLLSCDCYSSFCDGFVALYARILSCTKNSSYLLCNTVTNDWSTYASHPHLALQCWFVHTISFYVSQIIYSGPYEWSCLAALHTRMETRVSQLLFRRSIMVSPKWEDAKKTFQCIMQKLMIVHKTYFQLTDMLPNDENRTHSQRQPSE